MPQVLVRNLDHSVVKKLKEQALRNGRSLQAELKAILETQVRLAGRAEGRKLAARIRRRIGRRPQTDSGLLQAEDRSR
jgi:plasmid stability protein